MIAVSRDLYAWIFYGGYGEPIEKGGKSGL